MKLSINLELSSMAQAQAVMAALEIYVEMEAQREKDAAAGHDKFTADEKARLQGARQVLATLCPPAPRKVGQ